MKCYVNALLNEICMLYLDTTLKYVAILRKAMRANLNYVKSLYKTNICSLIWYADRILNKYNRYEICCIQNMRIKVNV